MTISLPHGGTLIDLWEPKYDFSKITKSIEIDEIALSDLELIGTGAYSPIKGFFTKSDYETVVKDMRLSSGHVWSIPITLPLTEKAAESLIIGEEVKLTHEGETYGVLSVSDIYTPDKQLEATLVYQTDDGEHPGVRNLYNRGMYMSAEK